MRSVLTLLLVFVVQVTEARPPADFTHDLSWIQTLALKNQVSHASSSFDPLRQLPGYTNDPEQTRYYKSVSQTSDQGLKTAGKSSQSVAKRMVTNAFDQRPNFRINQQSRALQKGKLIEKEAGNIVRGISDKYVNCQQARVCHIQTQTKWCNEATRFITQHCTKTPNVHVERVTKSVAHCRHLMTENYLAPAPKGGQFVGYWYPCSVAGCQKLYLVPGANQGTCIVSAISIAGYTTSASAAAGVVPAGFPMTLRIQDHGGVWGRYGTDVNRARAALSTGGSVGLAYGGTNSATSIAPFSKATTVQVSVHLWNTDNYSSRHIGLATLAVPAQITSKKTKTTWQEDCHA